MGLIQERSQAGSKAGSQAVPALEGGGATQSEKGYQLRSDLLGDVAADASQGDYKKWAVQSLYPPRVELS